MLMLLYLFGFLSVTFLFEIEAKPLMKNKRDVGDVAQAAVLYAVEEFNSRAKSPIGGGQNYKFEGAGKELDINYGAVLKDQVSRRRRSPQEGGNENGNDGDEHDGNHGESSGGHGGPPNGGHGGHGGPPPHGRPPGGHGGPPPHHNRRRRSPCNHHSTTPVQDDD